MSTKTEIIDGIAKTVERVPLRGTYYVAAKTFEEAIEALKNREVQFANLERAYADLVGENRALAMANVGAMQREGNGIDPQILTFIDKMGSLDPAGLVDEAAFRKLVHDKRESDIGTIEKATQVPRADWDDILIKASTGQPGISESEARNDAYAGGIDISTPDKLEAFVRSTKKRPNLFRLIFDGLFGK